MELLSSVISRQVLTPEALSTAIRDADFLPCQLSAKPSLSRMAHIMCPNVCLDFASLGPAMLFSGSMSKDCYTLVFVLKCERKGRSFNFSIEHHDGYIAFFPPVGVVDAYTPEGYENASLTVPTPVFLAAIERLFPTIPDSLLKHGGGIRVAPEEQIQLRGLLKTIELGLEDPAGPLVSESVRIQLESDLLDRFLTALSSGYESSYRPTLRVAEKMRRLRQARDYIHEHLHHPVQITDLCSELNMSKRGVELLFQNSLGVGPNAFLRLQRLHGVRRALQQVHPTPGSVKKSALDWGFWHLGHFAREYREVFGENPSVTLAHQFGFGVSSQ